MSACGVRRHFVRGGRRALVLALVACQAFSGCVSRRELPLKYLGDKDTEYYRNNATEIDYSAVTQETPQNVAFTQSPRTVRDRIEEGEIWDLPLQEAVHLAVTNNKIIRTADFNTAPGVYSTRGNSILNSSDFAPSVYDVAIQESGVLFGSRGVESALSVFDAQLQSSMVWGRTEQIQNNVFFGGGLTPGATLTNETGAFFSQLSKTFATGGTMSLSHTMNYLGTNAPATLFPSSFNGNVAATFTQPLWAGAGVNFTRIAGPIGASFNGITGVNQGVAIARINNDITIADFESNVMTMVFDVERAYWDLYLAYRNYDTATAFRKSGLRTWRDAKARFDIGAQGGSPAQEAQARDAYFNQRALEEAALNALNKQELALRRLCGLPVNDGRIIRPSDEPITADFIPDWQTAVAQAITRHVELRRQRWQVQSLELQLTAARSLTNPQLNFVSSYAVNGFGDQLLAYNDNDGVTTQGLKSAYGTMTQGDQTNWTTGFTFNMPVGFRAAHTQVRNIELRLARARQLLAAQEEELSYELGRTFQDLAANHAQAQSNLSRREAAAIRVEAEEIAYKEGVGTIDLWLRAQASLADADVSYYTSLVEYNKTISFLGFTKGTILDDYNIHLAEGGWSADAYRDAERRAVARTYAIDNPILHTEPAEYASPGPVDAAELIAQPPTSPSPAFPPAEPAPPPANGAGIDVPPPPPEEDPFQPK